ncbi:pre-peptidase C-terminal domain-containing protein [Acanthopleuribacter pedis]|uniref:Peptidase C-terminal archaeal/bacterial domain-containing protein n=1 Tax=Acanthopleuribacter pedis TaxID=442870 RepID=A0A8J7QDR2_9BACT|nr:pre-peptidase C-terminal domain-containing protein [Acanthopleuribacter pedis]MBO1317213.1 hypothetical protein [Acanthopleuribacter pedis]MBO1318519.1 hypothetical protein [Acanthopleuribacter pedis]
MLKTVLLRMLFCALAACTFSYAQTPSYPFGEGYFKEKLINAGPGVGATSTRRHADHLGWRFDVVSGGSSQEDMDRFVALMAGREEDRNGLLLYPDGSPRYRMMTVGGATRENGAFIGGLQGTLLGGRHPMHPHYLGVHMVKQFVEGGGGYAGFCAGMQLADNFQLTPVGMQDYLYPQDPGPVDSRFIGDYASDYGDIPNVLQWGGTYIHEYERHPGMEEIARMTVAWGNNSDRTMGATWFYTDPNNLDKGRLLLSGVHPEMNGDPHAVSVVSAMLEATIAGNHEPVLKKELENGVPHDATAETFTHDWTKIKVGDGQYHHYKVMVPAGQRYLRIDLGTLDPFDLHLFLHHDDYAFLGHNSYELVESGGSKVLVVDNPAQGAWFIGVKGASYPAASYMTTDEGIEVLNGIGYTLTATWSDQPECETAVLSAALLETNVCRGEGLDYQFLVAECAAGQSVNLELVNSVNQVVLDLGSHVVSAGTNTGTIATPTGLKEVAHRLRVTDAEGNQTESNPITMRAMQITATTNGDRFEPGSTLRLEWQARCDFEGQTLITLRNENHQEVARVLTNSSDYGLNESDFLLNQPPGNYYFRLYAAWISGDSNMFAIAEPSIESLVSNAAPVAAGFPFVVNWDATAGFDGVTGSLSLHDANGAFIKTLGSNLPLAEGVNTGTFSFTAADLAGGFNTSTVFLRFTAGNATRDSAAIAVTQTPAEILEAVPAILYENQVYSFRFRRNVLSDGSEWRLRFLDANGVSVGGQTVTGANTVGDHSDRMVIGFTNVVGPLRIQVENSQGTVAVTSTPFQVKAPTLTVYNDLAFGGITWEWDGEAGNNAVILIFDVATGAELFRHTMTNSPGINLYMGFGGVNLVPGREYRLTVGVVGRLAHVVHTETFIY